MDDTIIITRASLCLSIMNIHGARRAGHHICKACRLWTGGGLQRLYCGWGGAYREASHTACYNHFSTWTWVSRYENVSVLDFIGAKDDGGGEW